MGNNELIKYEGGLIKRVGNAISVTNKLLNVESDNVTPLNIGFETDEGLISIIFPLNTGLPAQKKETFIVSLDNQTLITIHLLQGFSKKALENKSLMKFSIYDTPTLSSGEQMIEVIFEIDNNGILHLSTQDKRFKIRVDEYFSGLSKDEIKEMKFKQSNNGK